MRLMWKKYKHENYDLDLVECGIHQCSPLDSYEYNVGRDYVIHCIISGKGFLEDGVKTHKLNKGQLFVFRKGQKVKYYPDFEDPWSYCWVAFSGALADKYLARFNFNQHNILSTQTGSELTSAIIELNDSIYRSPETDTELSRLAKVHRFFLVLCDELGLNTATSDANILNETFNTALEFINSNYQTPINVEEIASKLHITRGYLYKLFNDNLGTSPQAYLIHLRLFRASQLLKTTTLSIKEIAAQSGYSDQLYFSAQFKKHYTMSPKKYRLSS